ncbi:MAG: succinate dehydrogenase, cytochrome b556 subunit [Gemmatimonadetes bacterium]|nr:succinate dehydrogenase, cytochrome b556 subunit [Gemmatimonadota bacterium]
MGTAHRVRGLWTALRYRGREGMWTWLLHRATGIGILLFLVIHVIDTAIVIYWPGLYDHALNLYRNPVFRFAELLIFFSVLFHGLNGLRIIVQDFWPAAMLRQRQLALTAIAAAVILILPVAWIMLGPIFGLRDEPGTARDRARRAAMQNDISAYQGPAGPSTQAPTVTEVRP